MSLLVPASDADRTEVTSKFTVHTDFKPDVNFYDIFGLFRSLRCQDAGRLAGGAGARQRRPAQRRRRGGTGEPRVPAGALLADALDLPFVPVRKEGKLPGGARAWRTPWSTARSASRCRPATACPRDEPADCDDLLARG